jgi:hypothetical protein
MKKLAILIMAFGMSFTGFTQAPQAFAFQSTITHADGSPFINTDVSLLFNIRSVSGAGTIVFSESHTNVTTSSTGYFTASVGQGVPTVGAFSAINWNGSSYYLELLVDTLSGTGTNYVSLGASQLLSVPYALSAGNSAPSTYFYGELTGSYMGTADTIMFIASFNRNSGYDQATGIFTAPTAGIYEITIDPSGNAGVLDLYLNNNPAPVLSVANYPMTYTMELSSGDTIYLIASEYWSPKLKIVEIK